jgi:hypothetical protein
MVDMIVITRSIIASFIIYHLSAHFTFVLPLEYLNFPKAHLSAHFTFVLPLEYLNFPKAVKSKF